MIAFVILTVSFFIFFLNVRSSRFRIEDKNDDSGVSAVPVVVVCKNFPVGVSRKIVVGVVVLR